MAWIRGIAPALPSPNCNFRIPSRDVTLIDTASKLMHTTRSDFIRTAARIEAERVILAFAEQKVTFKE